MISVRVARWICVKLDGKTMSCGPKGVVRGKATTLRQKHPGAGRVKLVPWRPGMGRRVSR